MQLEELEVEQLVGLSDRTMIEIASRLGRLRRLNVEGMLGVSLVPRVNVGQGVIKSLTSESSPWPLGAVLHSITSIYAHSTC